MAYARKKGSQVVIVHGERDSDTGKVQQRNLFVLYSRAEAHAAMGESKGWFRQMLEREHPQIHFNWKKLDAGIKDLLRGLPETCSYKKARVDGCFRAALVDFTRELLVSDPQDFVSAARLLHGQRHELMYVRDLIDWRLGLADQEESEWNKDNPFYWKALMNRRTVPVEGMERLSELYCNTEYEKAEALARLLTECWSNYAEGYNYMGLVAMERDDLNAAQTHFKKAMEVGRTLFPKRIRKADYWSNHVTRPYIRAIIYSAQAYNCMGDYSKALGLCDRLEKECNLDVEAALERVPIYLNRGLWNEAASAARYVQAIHPEQNFPLAFALHEMGQEHRGLVHFLAGAIRFPRTAMMLCGLSGGRDPESSREVEDNNTGVTYLREIKSYLRNSKSTGPRFFKDILKHPKVIELIAEANEVRRQWSANRSSDRKWFHRMSEMESNQFAEDKVAMFWPDIAHE